MTRITDSTCIVESRELDHQTYEVCATCMAGFDEGASVLVVNLDCFVRKVNLEGPDTLLRPAWLPRPDSIRTHTTQEDAGSEAREAFRAWTGKVRGAIPPLSEFSASVSGGSNLTNSPA